MSYPKLGPLGPLPGQAPSPKKAIKKFGTKKKQKQNRQLDETASETAPSPSSSSTIASVAQAKTKKKNAVPKAVDWVGRIVWCAEKQTLVAISIPVRAQIGK